jgi:hypothetical protein
VAEQQTRPKARPVLSPQRAAKPKPHPQVAVKPKAVPRKLAKPSFPRPRVLARVPRRPLREARRTFEYPEERPHSGPVYERPPYAAVPAAPPALTKGCDEACQYRDWLNRYAAWYRDFGRTYHGAPPVAMAPDRPAPRAYSENRVPPPPAYRFDQSEQDRLDPWHGYNPYSPTNGY